LLCPDDVPFQHTDIGIHRGCGDELTGIIVSFAGQVTTGKLPVSGYLLHGLSGELALDRIEEA
jgi:NAD(P)H-hydrate repair Nnr-like enzyme with NAD(P)H-hydrate dehydratase domain